MHIVHIIIFSANNSITGHLWETVEIPGIVSSVIWKFVSAQTSNEGAVI